MKEKYLVKNIGCDDTTEFEIELTDEELLTIMRFIKENNKVAVYHCQPKIKIFVTNSDEDNKVSSRH